MAMTTRTASETAPARLGLCERSEHSRICPSAELSAHCPIFAQGSGCFDHDDNNVIAGSTIVFG